MMNCVRAAASLVARKTGCRGNAHLTAVITSGSHRRQTAKGHNWKQGSARTALANDGLAPLSEMSETTSRS